MQQAGNILKAKPKASGAAKSLLARKPVHPVTARINPAAEKKADRFADDVVGSEKIKKQYGKFASQLSIESKNRKSNIVENNVLKLPTDLQQALQENFAEDFSGVEIQMMPAREDARELSLAAAFTDGNQIFLNPKYFDDNPIKGLWILAHELFHVLQNNISQKQNDAQLKPIAELHDRTPEQQKALDNAAIFALNEQGKVNSNIIQEDNTRLGWEQLLEYFKTSFGEENIANTAADYAPGKLLADIIKYVKKGKAQKVKLVDGNYVVTTENNVDLLPSWCGIFIFWALHKAGIHPPLWQIGKANITAKDAYKKNAYVPRPGDIVIKNGFNHFAMVVKVIPEGVTDTKDLQSLKVVTINGNTAGSNHLGGQIQEKTDPYSYWDFYINPFFRGVQMNADGAKAAENALHTTTTEVSATPHEGVVKNASDTSLSSYTSDLDPLPNFTEEKSKDATGEEKSSTPIDEAKSALQPDPAFVALQSQLKDGVAKTKSHTSPESKASQAAASAISPPNERMSTAKANKVEALGAIPKPKEFKGAVLKEAILKEVDKLLKDKEDEAGRSGKPPKINEKEVADVKQKNQEDIQQQKSDSAGPVEKAQKQPPNETAVKTRTNTDVIKEDAGKSISVKNSEDAVAKPLADQRITLQKESDALDKKMEEKDVTEQQLQDSGEPRFNAALNEKQKSQQQADNIKTDYRTIEEKKLEADKSAAKKTISGGLTNLHGIRENMFGKVDTVKDKTKSADEVKRKEIADKIEKIYTDAETSVNTKLEALDNNVNVVFDRIMASANENFKKNVNEGLDNEFTSEFFAKLWDESDFNRRVKKVFNKESEKYKTELSNSLDPLTNHIAATLNGVMLEIKAAKDAVLVYVNGLPAAMQEMAAESAKAVLDKFTTLEQSVDEKQQALTGNLAKKYADGVSNLEEEFKKIMDERKSWLAKAFDAIVGVIKEILELLAQLKKALDRAAQYASDIIKAPVKFFANLAKGVAAGFNNFLTNIEKHLLTGALEWITGQMGDAGIQLPPKFDFKGILSIVLQILGLTVDNVKKIARKVIGDKYVDMLEKGIDFGLKVGDKIFKIFTIIKNEGIAGLWEFIKEQFENLKEQLMEDAKSFIVTTIIEKAVVKLASLLIPGAGFVSAVKSLIDFVTTLFAKAKQTIQIINGILDTFGEILAGNVAKVAGLVENVLGKLLGLAISFLANMLGLGGIGKKIADIIQKKIKDPINKAITKVMEKLKSVMTKLGIFKLMDAVSDKIKKGKAYIDDKKEKAKAAAKKGLDKFKGFLKNLFTKYKDQNGETHTLKFKDTTLYRESVSVTLGNYLNSTETKIKNSTLADKQAHLTTIATAFGYHDKIVKLIGKTVKEENEQYDGSDKGFGPKKGEELRSLLASIATELKKLPPDMVNTVIPKVNINYAPEAKDGTYAVAKLLSLHSEKHVGSQPTGNKSALSEKIIKTVKKTKTQHNLVRGHLINHELFGTGEDTKNLAPIPKMANSAMLNDFETDAKRLVHSNNIISLVVGVEYGLANQPDLKKDLGDEKIPVSINYKYTELKYSGTATTDDTIIDNPKNWVSKPGGESKKNKLSIHHADFF